jgi:uncharacterized Zn ribbon protein
LKDGKKIKNIKLSNKIDKSRDCKLV